MHIFSLILSAQGSSFKEELSNLGKKFFECRFFPDKNIYNKCRKIVETLAIITEMWYNELVYPIPL